MCLDVPEGERWGSEMWALISVMLFGELTMSILLFDSTHIFELGDCRVAEGIIPVR